eukprot:TRINITY_DN475_c0_g1_i1.p1 TRINITY_DN475_c0_g1~~TRINITY_DN475_c0_g1_i1.p1  ORF type:complete len:233 (-),score=43.15 TRINITY_DN475_c0_g1_i1:50-748(-)
MSIKSNKKFEQPGLVREDLVQENQPQTQIVVQQAQPHNQMIQCQPNYQMPMQPMMFYQHPQTGQLIPSYPMQQPIVVINQMPQQINQNRDPGHVGGHNNAVGVFQHGSRIALLSSKDKYLSFKKDKIKHSKKRQNTEVWIVESCDTFGKNLFALKNEYDGRYLSCFNEKLRLESSRGQHEIWRVKQELNDHKMRYLICTHDNDEYLTEGLVRFKLKDGLSYKNYWDVELIDY